MSSDHRMMQQRAAIAVHGISSALELLDEIWRRDPDLVEVRFSEVPPARELWMLTRRDVQKTPRIRVVSDFLLDLVKRERSLFEGK